MTVLAHGGGRPMGELLAWIAAVNAVGSESVRLATPLLPGEARDLRETFRAEHRLRGRETMVHAIVTQVLLDWCATASGQARADILQRLALRLDAWLDEPGSPSRRALRLALIPPVIATLTRRALRMLVSHRIISR